MDASQDKDQAEPRCRVIVPSRTPAPESSTQQATTETFMSMQPQSSSDDLLGHNARGAVLKIEARFFNSLAKYSGVDGVSRKLELPAGVTVGDIIAMFALPVADIYLVLRNGRDITPGLYQGGVVNQDVVLDDGDVIAFSGPVPYSYGYGAPVV